ncbi:unnamed protein product [Ceutorhynchus assimilis]|uniref:CHK kinase-like domain-containing protein n=1 Tax=Ceutorhynchus assimilis TaxID=467358 RepID=A0A9N9MCW8_9CUCU|nr:unnamed protein product [Ceutorhynchus assimilis]
MYEEIPKLNDLLKGYFDGEIIKQSISLLTAAGENYGSLMLKVDVTVKNNSGKEEIIPTVAKCVPTNEKMREIFSTHVTFKNEIGWYQQVIPAFLQFQREQGVENIADFFMNIYGARISLNPESKEVDQHGVILCENLHVRRFTNVDRRIGFNLDQAREIIKKLAIFHAMSLGLKIKKPELFNEKVKTFVSTLTYDGPKKKNEFYLGPINVIKENPETSHLASRFEDKIKSTIEQEVKKSRELWSTAIHTDFWVNNVMIKETEETLGIIILDLQTCGYASVVQDLIFFLGTSIENATTNEHFSEFIKLYYNELITNLESLKVDTSQFSYESFEEELKLEAAGQLIHILFMIPIILAEKGSGVNTNDKEFNPSEGLEKMFRNITEKHREKWAVLAAKFAEQNWI